MSNLPNELIIEILTYLPVKSLLRFRSVSQSWLILISSPNFINSHLNRSIEIDKLSLFFKSGQDFFHLPYPINFQSPDPPLKLHFPFQNSSSYSLSMSEIVGSCNGLLCLSTYSNTVFLLNPSNRFHTQIPDSPAPFPGYAVSRFPVLGFGYSSLTREYKIVQIVYFHPAESTVDSFHSEVKVYTLGTNSWRRIGDIPCYIRDRSSGILVNESLHWIATPGRRHDYNNNQSSNSSVILSFDIGNEEFGNVPMPKFDGNNYRITFLGALRGSLCMFRSFYSNRVEVWVMKEYGVRESWTLQFTIGQSLVVGNLKYFKPLRFLKNGELLLERSNGKLVMYDPRSEIVTDFKVHGIPVWFGTVDYVESLVSIKDEEPQCA